MTAGSIASSLVVPVSATLLTVLVAIVVIFTVALLISSYRNRDAPPSAYTPIVGLLKFVQGPWGLIKESYARHGEVFRVPVLHKHFTFLLEPHVMTHFYNGRDDQVSQKEAYEFNVPTFGKGVVYDVPTKQRDEQFRMLKDGLRTSMMETYVSQMVEEAELFFKKWGDEGVVDLKVELGGLIILTASRTLLGREVREHLFEQVSELIHELDEGMVPLSVLFPYLPIEPHRRRDKARIQIGKIFSKLIRDRRTQGRHEADMLDAFINAHYKDGRPLTDDEITGLLIATLFGGQHTSSITSVWAGMEILRKKEVLDKVLAEQKRTIAKHGASLDYDSLNELDYLHVCVKETLRLHPPLLVLMRYVHQSFSVTTKSGKSYIVPKGDTVVTCPMFTHNIESIFEKHTSFNPERFLEKEFPPFAFTSFGGGRHICLGQSFAYMQIKTIWSVIFRQFEVELEDPVNFPQPDLNAMVICPNKPCLMKYKRRVTPLA